MTFLLFLLSLAVLDRVVTWGEKSKSRGGPAPETALRNDLDGEAVASAGLAALGSSLDRFGRGHVPSGEPPQTPSTDPVRSEKEVQP